ncbi:MULTISPECIES: hypothetical protein [unclassified Mesorhizobium]|uniref:hypothetical protein n=1 Tax=unclassified Mesorhizobium TaxID=325217 RepID=UPI001FF07806|nr:MULTISPECIES: hypothetical protein [unclassified Mesorhizobium]
MADSDNTTTLSSVMQGRELVSSLTAVDTQGLADCLVVGQPLADPALTLSLAWLDAHTATLASCVRQQRAEGGLWERGVFSTAGEVVECAERTDAERVYLDTRQVEQDDAEKADALLAEIAATAAQSLAGVIAKLAVVVREANDNSDLCEFPLPHIRSALADLRRLTNDAAGDPPAGWPRGEPIGSLFEQSASSFAAWRAFGAWCQGDDETYRGWTQTFKTLHGANQ